MPDRRLSLVSHPSSLTSKLRQPMSRLPHTPNRAPLTSNEASIRPWANTLDSFEVNPVLQGEGELETTQLLAPIPNWVLQKHSVISSTCLFLLLYYLVFCHLRVLEETSFSLFSLPLVLATTVAGDFSLISPSNSHTSVTLSPE